MNESPTPRTDAVENEIDQDRFRDGRNSDWKMNDFARQLERELAQFQARCAELERERDLAIAHDRQPYPTAAAYEAVCEAHRQCRERIAELEKDAARYRWLRTPELLIALNLVWGLEVPPNTGQSMVDACDTAIDSALSRKD